MRFSLFPVKILAGRCVTKLQRCSFVTHALNQPRYTETFAYNYCIKKQYKMYNLDSGPSMHPQLTATEALTLYERMKTMRRMETACGELYNQRYIRGFCHLYLGQEAVAVGIQAAMRDKDSLTTAYRCHGFTYLMGGGILAVLSELMGRSNGCSRGKGGSMHMFGRNYYGGNGIVGAQVPLGAGVAFAHQYKGDGGVSFTLYGDGAANQGQVFETMNMAKLWNLPCVFICENNKYGLGTPAGRSSACTEYYIRGQYLPGIWVDGMDVIATREATRFAIEHCISGKGPLVIEMETYRYNGHSMSDPGTSYRTREEIQEVRQSSDPIITFKQNILDAKLVTSAQLKAIDTKARNEVNKAVEQAKIADEIGLEELAADVYKECLDPYNQIRAVTVCDPLYHISVKGNLNVPQTDIECAS